MPLLDFCTSVFQLTLKIIIIVELFIVMTTSPGKMVIHNHTSLTAVSARPAL